MTRAGHVAKLTTHLLACTEQGSGHWQYTKHVDVRDLWKEGEIGTTVRVCVGGWVGQEQKNHLPT
jgi:hypothetical protein